MKRLELHNILLENKELSKQDQRGYLLRFLSNKLQCSNNPEHVNNINTILRNQFFNKYSVKWNNSSRTNDRFILNNEVWLNGEINFILENSTPSTSGK